MTKDTDLDATAAHVKALGKILDAHTAEYIVRAVKSYKDMAVLLQDILEWDGILPHSQTRIKAVLAKATG